MPKKNWITPNCELLKLEKLKVGTDGVTESRPGIGPSRFNDAASSPSPLKGLKNKSLALLMTMNSND